jgi:TRAP-type C4-dicarboxylate transport system permease small subunit
MALKDHVTASGRVVERSIDLVCNGVLLTTGMALLILLSTVALLRYAFQTGLSFAPDLSEVLFAFFVMAGIVKAARQSAHVATQLMIHLLTGWARLALSLVIHGVTALVYLTLAWYAYLNALIAHDQTTPVLQIPWSVGYGCLAAGLALVGMSSLLVILRQTVGGEPVLESLSEEAAAT